MKMSEDLCGRPMRVGQIRRRTASGQCGAKLALAQAEPHPESLPGAFASPAVGNDADRRADAGDGGFEESPQRVGGHAQPPNFVGEPDAEGSAAARTRMAIAAEDSPSADRLALRIAFVVAAQKAVSDEGTNPFAMRTRGLLEPLRHRTPFVIAPAKPAFFAQVHPMPRENHSAYERGKCGVEAGYDKSIHERGARSIADGRRRQNHAVIKNPPSDPNSATCPRKCDPSEVKDT